MVLGMEDREICAMSYTRPANPVIINSSHVCLEDLTPETFGTAMQFFLQKIKDQNLHLTFITWQPVQGPYGPDGHIGWFDFECEKWEDES
jgi:hypothetical protein